MKIQMHADNKPSMSQRGEIAALLTVVSVFIIGIGVSLGSSVLRSEQTINTQTEARGQGSTGSSSGSTTTGSGSSNSSSSGLSSIFDNLGRILTGNNNDSNIPTDSIGDSTTTSALTPTPINKDPRSIWFRRQAGGEVCGGGFVCVDDPIVRKVEIRRQNGSTIMELDQALASNYYSGIANEVNILSPYGVRIDKCTNTTKGISVEYNPEDIARYYDPTNQSPIHSLLVDRQGNRLLEPEEVIIFSVTSNTRPPTLHFIYKKTSDYVFGAEEAVLYFEYDATLERVTQRYSQTAPIAPGCIHLSPTPTPSNTPTPTEGPSPTPTPTPTASPTPTPSPTPSAGPSPTPSTTPTEGPSPTPSPTVTPTPQACTFKALAFVQECTEWEDKNRGICKKDASGYNIGKPIVEEQFELSQDAPQHNLETPWLITNNLGQSSPLAYYPNLNNKRTTGSYYSIEDFDPSPWNDKDADISLAIDSTRYQFLPYNGKEIRKSVPVGANVSRFQGLYSNQDTIHGLKIACQQDIEYGWTLQRCERSFDYVFVMDTSTSMSRFDDPYYGKRKIDVMKDNLHLVLESIERDGSNSRAALVQFNRSSTVLSQFSSDFPELRRIVLYDLNIAEGTNIESALAQAHTLIQNRTDRSRPPVVVFLTDGLPNSKPGGPHPPNGYEPLIEAETQKLDSIADITIAAIGYGNPSLANSNIEDLPGAQLFDMIRKIATDESWAFSTDTTRAETAGSINEIYSRITSRLNSCTQTAEFVRVLRLSKDINKDGVINSLDLLLVFNTYFQQGSSIQSDINQDQVVNAIDSSLVIEDIGAKVELEDEVDVTSLVPDDAEITTSPDSLELESEPVETEQF